METEVAKAEEKAAPLSTARSRASMLPEQMDQGRDELDAAVDSARDFLAAAREQVQELQQDQPVSSSREPDAVKQARMEAIRMTARLNWFETRLTRAAATSKAIHEHTLNRRKA